MPQNEFTLKTQDGLSLYGLDWHTESPRGVVCLVHGLGEHIHRYDRVAAALTATGLGFIGFDLRGHGKSEGLRGHAPSFDRLLDDISLFLDEAARRYPGQKRILYGHSLGGLLVLKYAFARRPELAGLISTSPALKLATPAPRLKVAAGRVLYRIAPKMTMANGLELASLSTDPAVIKAYKADPLVHDKISARLGMDMLDAGQWVLAQKTALPFPLLLVHGRDDRICSAAATEAFAKSLPGAVTLKIWDGMLHETHNDANLLPVLEYMLKWINARI